MGSLRGRHANCEYAGVGDVAFGAGACGRIRKGRNRRRKKRTIVVYRGGHETIGWEQHVCCRSPGYERPISVAQPHWSQGGKGCDQGETPVR